MAIPPETDELTATDVPTLGRAAFQRVNARDFAGARTILERALSLHPKDVMLTHVWAHMVDGSGETAAGAAELRDLLDGSDTSHGLHAHTCSHLANLEAELDHPAAALELYERYVAPYVAGRPIMFAGAVALLWRLELMGFGRASGRQLPWPRLREARDHILATPSKPGAMANPPALDHVAHGITLITTGDEPALVKLQDELRAAGDALLPELAVPVILGLRAYWRGDHAAAIDLLAPLAASSGRLAKTADPLPLIDQTLSATKRSGRRASTAA